MARDFMAKGCPLGRVRPQILPSPALRVGRGARARSLRQALEVARWQDAQWVAAESGLPLMAAPQRRAAGTRWQARVARRRGAEVAGRLLGLGPLPVAAERRELLAQPMAAR